MNRLLTLLVTSLVLTQSLYSASLPIQAIALTSSSPAARGNAAVVKIYVRLSASDGRPRTQFGPNGWTIKLLASPIGFCPGTAPFSYTDNFGQTKTAAVAVTCTLAIQNIQEIDTGVYMIQASPIYFPTTVRAKPLLRPWVEGEYLFRLVAVDGLDRGDVLCTFKI